MVLDKVVKLLEGFRDEGNQDWVHAFELSMKNLGLV